MRWFTSDLHFGHRNVIAYCDRPYNSVTEMNEKLIEQWNSQVSPEDEVYFLGDFGINKKKCTELELVQKLNGKKYIILGNHDVGFVHGHEGKEKFETTKQKLIAAGWSGVDLRLDLTLKNGYEVTMTHLPPSNECDNRYSQYKLPNDLRNTYLHGHLHGNYRKNQNLIDVAFDGDLKLLSEDDIISLINDKREFIPTRLTNKFQNNTAFNLMPFEEEVKKQYVRRVNSSDGKLTLYNYTNKCTYDRAWNDVTRYARGIIFERATGRIVAIPFPKFFNVGEMPETRLENLPDEPYLVSKKMDGSLGIIYHYDGEWKVATRGSFTSPQALRGQEILKKYDMSEVPTELTLLTEIIYPENKIVANYGDKEELVLLAAVNRETQTEVNTKTLDLVCRDTGMSLVEYYAHSIEHMIELQQSLPKDEEGFVVRFESGLRIKIKGKEYLRIHKLISCMSPLSFWESMKEGKVNISYLQELPEEYREEADKMKKKLEKDYQEIYLGACEDYHRVKYLLKIDEDTNEARRKLGIYIKKSKPRHAGAFFPIHNKNKNQVEKYVMKTIRPKDNVWVEDL